MNKIDYTEKIKYHYRPKKGWINDPNGLVYFKGYYHVFYQHAPDYEAPWKQPMHWGHARTKDFLNWEELPVALTPGDKYDGGCWSGTAAVAVSEDGINFKKYEGNPVIATYPPDGGPDFRDPAVCKIDGQYYCVSRRGGTPSVEGQRPRSGAYRKRIYYTPKRQRAGGLPRKA
ncbi:MAG: glycoside hydrolase family 32 protein [Clostridia bacterium]|nr:glycoside hydrolase family 32 protein [Clostridia bacterium]